MCGGLKPLNIKKSICYEMLLRIRSHKMLALPTLLLGDLQVYYSTEQQDGPG